jgi:hypothetical protein
MKLTRIQMEALEKRHLMVVAWCLKQRRLNAHLSQVELALEAYVSRGEVQHVEHWRHGMREGTKFRLCTALDISIIEMDAEVMRVTQTWKEKGPPKGYEEA